MYWNDKKVEQVIEILNQCETVLEASKKLSKKEKEKITPSAIRKAFKRYGYESPSNYLLGEEAEFLFEEEDFQNYEVDGDWYYNKTDDLYLIFVKHKHKPMMLPGDLVREMKDAYSNMTAGGGDTINEMCRSFGMSRKDFFAVKSAFNWTHDEDPFTDEEILEKETDTLVSDLVQKKRGDLERKFRKKEWKEIEKDADDWRKLKFYFKTKDLSPKTLYESYSSVLDAKTYIDNLEINKTLYKKEVSEYELDFGKTTAIIPVSDIHEGKKFKSKNVNHTSFSTSIIKERQASALRYLNSLPQEVKDRIGLLNYSALGDNFESLFGNMRAGQYLTMDSFGYEQYSKVIEFHVEFISSLKEIFPGTPIRAVFQGGNHDRFFKDKTYESEDVLNAIMTDRIAQDFKNDKDVSIIIGAPITSLMLPNGVNLISHHGHLKKITDKSATNFINIHGVKNAKRHIILQGHFHEFSLRSGFNYKVITNSSFCGNDSFNLDKLAVGSPAEFCLIESSEHMDMIHGPFNLDHEIY